MEWRSTVKNEKSLKIQAKIEKRLKWKNLFITCPHIITPQKAKYLQNELNIDYLENSFLSEGWINIQLDGWVYVKTIKSGKNLPILEKTDEFEYMYVTINNKWLDKALFKRIYTPVNQSASSD